MSLPPRDPVWLAVAREPASVRPAFTAITGFFFVTRRAIRTKFFGFPKFSRYIRITFVSGSSSQLTRRSFPLTSALFPRDANFANPSFRFRAWSRIATPRAPLWERNEMWPRSGGGGGNVGATWPSRGGVVTPLQFRTTRAKPRPLPISPQPPPRSPPTP